MRFQEESKHKNTHTYQDPHAFGQSVCKVERSQTTFLSPDGFVQAPWKPLTQIHRPLSQQLGGGGGGGAAHTNTRLHPGTFLQGVCF